MKNKAEKNQVIVGYYLEFALAIILGCSLLIFERMQRRTWSAVCRNISIAYADSAIALALAVELAASIMLIKRNFGLGSNDFGALTVEIVWVVALLVMLPITTFCWQDLKDKKFELRICVIALTFVLFLATFVSRMISTYSEGQIGTGDDKAMSTEEYEQIQLLCRIREHALSSSAHTLMEVFSIGGSMWASCLVIAALVKQCLYGSQIATVKWLKHAFKAVKDEKRILSIIVSALIVWSVPLFWVLMKLREGQAQFARDLEESNGSETWTFGQILAVVVFMPVVVEVLNQYLQRHDGTGLITDTSRASHSGDPRQEKTW